MRGVRALRGILVVALGACWEPSTPLNPSDGGVLPRDAPVHDQTPELPRPDASALEAEPSDAAGEPDATDPLVPATCREAPAAGNTVLPFFDAIFTDPHPVSNHFDHDEPKEFSDRNGYQIDWCGRRRTAEIDGHSGYDFVMPEGTPLLSPADGVVNWAGNDVRFFCPLKNREITDQLRVEVTHRLPDGRRVTSNFKHLSRVDVRAGQTVRAGAQLGLSGNTGCSTGPHLHFETWLMDGTKTGRSVLFDAFGWQGAGADPWPGKADGAPSIWLWKPGQAPPR
jgi:murein DD-endopeptidase MepM/ murein hydrolase activator NlpD